VSRTRYIIALVILFLLANLARGLFRGEIAAPRYAAEGASHFRYTRMVAEGRAIPALDRDAQWPEGLRVYEETAVGMEYLYGLAYRLLPAGAMSLHAFTAVFTALLFSLALFPAAFLAEALWGSRWAGLVAALLFVVSPALVARSSGFELIRENLAFPLLVWHLWLFVAAAAKSAYWRSIRNRPARSTASSATGLGNPGRVRLLDAPHTEANYLMQEMGYQIARKHADRLRLIAFALLFAVPVVLLLAAVAIAGNAGPTILIGLAALSAGPGVLVERWLFFAEAKHVVTLYYGERMA
ncbi:MAG TPA: hypothetical protein ENO23_08700, partial [Alphaproteobacteria bacterium]|nr:hypothetical protein [Alphaproteobacteria bacterium]